MFLSLIQTDGGHSGGETASNAMENEKNIIISYCITYTNLLGI